jgi:hypothetical protein
MIKGNPSQVERSRLAGGAESGGSTVIIAIQRVIIIAALLKIGNITLQPEFPLSQFFL